MVEDFENFYWKKNNAEDQKISSLNYLKRKFLAYLVASRSPTIIITVAFLLLGEWLAVKSILLYPTIIMILFLILVEFINGFTNFTFDKTIDIFARKHTIWVFKYISTKEMLAVSALFSIIGLIILWYYFTILITLTGAILIILTILYAAPPIRLKTKPPLDIITNMLILGSLQFILGGMITGLKININFIILALIVGISVVVNNLLISWQDIKTDQELGIKTSCVVLGYNWTIATGIILWVIMIFLSYYYVQLDITTISFLIVLPVLTILWIRHKKLVDYSLRQKNVNLFLSIATTLWCSSIFLYLSIITKSIIPIIFFIIEISALFLNIKIFYYINCNYD